MMHLGNVDMENSTKKKQKTSTSLNL